MVRGSCSRVRPTACGRSPLHHGYWSLLRRFTKRPRLDFYALRHTATTLLLERGATPWDVAIQLCHTDGGQLVMSLYGHPSEAGARSRLLAAWEAEVHPLRAATDVTSARLVQGSGPVPYTRRSAARFIQSPR